MSREGRVLGYFMGCLLGLIIAVSPVMALDWESRCINESYMSRSSSLNLNGNLYTYNQTVYCQYNCTNLTGQCNPVVSSDEKSVALAIALVGVAFILAYIGIKMKEQHWMMQFMFLGASLLVMMMMIFVISGSDVLTQLQVQNVLTGGYGMIMWIIIIFILYFIILFIAKYINETLRGSKE